MFGVVGLGVVSFGFVGFRLVTLGFEGLMVVLAVMCAFVVGFGFMR